MVTLTLEDIRETSYAADDDDIPLTWIGDGDITLTPEQQAAVDGVAALAARGVSVCGAAGTGKSTVTKAIKARLEAAGWTVGLATPTHKAGHVLAKACGVDKASVLTFAALLGLREKKVGGESKFVRDPRARLRLKEADVWICDEASMLSTELLDLMVKEGLPLGTRFVFVGDPHQLPPVGHSETSPSLQLSRRFDLTQVHRHGGSILDCATAIRTGNTHWRVRLSEGEHAWDGSSITAYRDPADWRAEALRLAKEHHGGDPDAFRILCFRNQAAAQANAAIRRHVYGPGAPSFVPGERLITLGAITDPDNPSGPPLSGSSREITVLAAEDRLGSIDDPNPERGPWYMTTWDLTVQADGGIPHEISAVDPAQAWQLDEALAELAADAKSRAARGLSRPWRYFWEARDAFAQLGGHWALTVHRSQGSQFQRVFIDTGDLDTAPDRAPWKVRRALWYVAITRAQQAVHLIADAADGGQL